MAIKTTALLSIAAQTTLKSRYLSSYLGKSEFIFQARFHEKAHTDLGKDFITDVYVIHSFQPLIFNSIPEHCSTALQ